MSLEPHASALKFHCTSCGQKLSAPRGLEGEKFTCPNCRFKGHVPGAKPRQAPAFKEKLIRFFCTHCGQKLSCDAKAERRTIKCPICLERTIVAVGADLAPEAGEMTGDQRLRPASSPPAPQQVSLKSDAATEDAATPGPGEPPATLRARPIQQAPGETPLIPSALPPRRLVNGRERETELIPVDPASNHSRREILPADPHNGSPPAPPAVEIELKAEDGSDLPPPADPAPPATPGEASARTEPIQELDAERPKAHRAEEHLPPFGEVPASDADLLESLSEFGFEINPVNKQGPDRKAPRGGKSSS